jgi:TetR/AcrR family transcriptional regulator, transcriptional repressor for nem operon
MSRPREFDEDAVLDAVMDCFWNRGYQATSMRDLAERTGLTTASLYNAFGDKHAIYRIVLERYTASGLAGFAKVFESGLAPLRALEAFFDTIVAEALNDKQRKGCLAVNTALEVAPHDEDLKRLVTQGFERLETYLQRCVAAGQADGSIKTTQPSGDVAKMLLGAVLGLRVLARMRPDKKTLTGATRPHFAMLRGA